MFSNLDECILDIKNTFVNYAYFSFSPATASFDQFDNFPLLKRGKYFKNIVCKILGEKNV